MSISGAANVVDHLTSKGTPMKLQVPGHSPISRTRAFVPSVSNEGSVHSGGS
jgi:hypothetical protein